MIAYDYLSFKLTAVKVLILVPGPKNTLPSQRFRVEHYLRNEDNKSIEFVLSSFYFLWAWKVLYKKGNAGLKVLGVLAGFLKRFFTLFTLFEYDYIYIHREAASVGPPIFEWVIAKVWRKRIIYDFDDSIWVSASSASNPLASYVKCNWKVKHICKWSHIITVGNDYLADYAGRYNNDVRVIPTVVDTENRHKFMKEIHEGVPTIGWTGTFTNFDQFELIKEAMQNLQERYDFKLQIIADKDPAFTDFKYEYKPWKEESEITDLLQFDIGIMPLRDSAIQLGKCAFKAIQYMSLGIPSVVSPVGANCKVVLDGVNGLWANNSSEWIANLENLLLNKELRAELGRASRLRVVNRYSVAATEHSFFDMFKAPEQTFSFGTIFTAPRFTYKPGNTFKEASA
ncbi:MAG: glycosyltransferase [Chitinophagaceae bacterium]|nr:MAG: glycosyltransferase [Chitinophagaceae bacterium]